MTQPGSLGYSAPMTPIDRLVRRVEDLERRIRENSADSTASAVTPFSSHDQQSFNLGSQTAGVEILLGTVSFTPPPLCSRAWLVTAGSFYYMNNTGANGILGVRVQVHDGVENDAVDGTHLHDIGYQVDGKPANLPLSPFQTFTYLADGLSDAVPLTVNLHCWVGTTANWTATSFNDWQYFVAGLWLR